jgi:glucose-1-phosphate adenylyltransferase
VIEVGEGTKVASFKEKPATAPGLPDSPDEIFASMGNYVFTTRTLIDIVSLDAEDQDSHHDIGGSIIPALVEAGEAHVYDFTGNHVPGETERDHAYWRDVGSLDSYYDAHMDLVSVHPIFNLYNREWPIYTSLPTLPPAKFVLQGEEAGTGKALDSMVCAGSIISGGTVRSSVISPGVLVQPHATVDNCVLMHDVVIGQGAVVRNAIIDKNVHVPPGAQIGVERDLDESRFTVSPNGIVVIGKGEKVPEA